MMPFQPAISSGWPCSANVCRSGNAGQRFGPVAQQRGQVVAALQAQPAQHVGQPVGQAVIVCKSMHVSLERIRCCSRQNTGLTHPTTKHLSPAVSRVDHALRADQRRTNRCAQSLRQADGHRVEMTGDLHHRHAKRDRGIEKPGAIEVQSQPAGTHQRPRVGQVGQGQHLASLGILDGEEARLREV
jgi:hypothetical protein